MIRKIYMLSYFNSKTPASKKDNPEKKLVADEKLVRFDDYIELDNKLQQAQDRIQELEALLESKEQLHDELHQKIQLLTTTIEQEKSIAQDQKTQFTQEEDALANEIASLKVDLLKQEAHYEILYKKNIALHAEQEAKLTIQEQYKNLQKKMSEKEREYEILVKKLAELEIAKLQAEERLIQEKNEHKETKSALEIEQKAKQTNKSQPKKEEPVTRPTLANNSATIFTNIPRKQDYRKSIFSEPWEFYAGF